MEGGGQGRVWNGVMKGGDRCRYSLILVSSSFVGGRLRTWTVVFVCGRRRHMWVVVLVRGCSSLCVGGCLRMWAFVFVCGRWMWMWSVDVDTLWSDVSPCWSCASFCGRSALFVGGMRRVWVVCIVCRWCRHQGMGGRCFWVGELLFVGGRVRLPPRRR